MATPYTRCCTWSLRPPSPNYDEKAQNMKLTGLCSSSTLKANRSPISKGMNCYTGRPVGLKVKPIPAIAYFPRSPVGKLAAYPFASANVTALPPASNKVLVSDASADVTVLAKQAVRQVRDHRTTDRYVPAGHQ